MAQKKTTDLQQLPVGRLGIISPYSCAELTPSAVRPIICHQTTITRILRESLPPSQERQDVSMSLCHSCMKAASTDVPEENLLTVLLHFRN